MLKPYLHKVYVSPKNYIFSVFPIDMLRHDCLYPNSEQDSEKIMQCFSKPSFKDDKPTIILECVAWKTWEPTYERWNSFLWTVMKHEVVGKK